MAKKKKAEKNLKKNMISKYLTFMETPVKHFDGKIRPPVRHPMKWHKIEPISLTGEFIDFDEHLKDNDVWIWSDQHFNHENVIKHSTRPFKTSEDMNYAMIENYEDTVKDGDVVIWAGDLFFKSQEDFKENIMPHFNKTYNILVVGNHDFQGKVVKNLPFDEIHLLLDFNVDGQRVVVTHYPFGKPEDDFTNVHGHIHQNESEEDHQINVSVEAINYTPVSLKDLL